MSLTIKVPRSHIRIQGNTFMKQSASIENKLVSSTSVEHKVEKGLTAKEIAIRALAIVAIASEVVLMGFGVKCGINKIKGHINQTTAAATETVQPSQTATTESITTTTENALTQKVESYVEVMKKYKEMSVDKFEALPRDERLLYSQFIIDRTVATGNYNNGYGKGMLGQDFAVEYTPVSIDNDGQEIVDNGLYGDQISYLQFKVTEKLEKLYDASDGIKCLSSVYYEVGNDKNISYPYINSKANKETLAKSVCLSNKYTATNTSDLLDGVDSNGDKIQYKIVTYYDQDSKTRYARFIYHEFTDYDGTRQSIWLFDTEKDTLEGLNK